MLYIPPVKTSSITFITLLYVFILRFAFMNCINVLLMKWKTYENCVNVMETFALYYYLLDACFSHVYASFPRRKKHNLWLLDKVMINDCSHRKFLWVSEGKIHVIIIIFMCSFQMPHTQTVSNSREFLKRYKINVSLCMDVLINLESFIIITIKIGIKQFFSLFLLVIILIQNVI